MLDEIRNIIDKHLKEFGDEIVTAASKNLKTGKLKQSLDYEVGEDHKLAFIMEEYGAYKDLGVSGVSRKYKTPFSYKNKKPRIKDLEQWARKNNLKLSKNMTYRSLAFLLQNSIYNKGIKPSLFLTKPFERLYKDYNWDGMLEEIADYISKETIE